MEAEKPEIPPPLLLASIICDQVITDQFTKKTSIIGAFDSIAAPRFPARNPSLAFFCQLTNGRGKVLVTIRLVDVEKNDEILFEGKMEAKFRDVREVTNMTFNFGGFVFPHPGEYRFQLYIGKEFLGERAIILRQVELPPGDKK
ncbi:MAG: DUF6941 family protein [Planctomycetota bacterium]|jgi:hypothetical protein